MVISYERTTTSWSAGKIHSELGILPSGPTQNNVSNNVVAPMEIDRGEKVKQKGKGKEKYKGKNNPKGKGKGKNEKGKGKSSQPSRELQLRMINVFTAAATAISSVIAGSFTGSQTPSR